MILLTYRFNKVFASYSWLALIFSLAIAGHVVRLKQVEIDSVNFRQGKDFAVFFAVGEYRSTKLTHLELVIPNAESIAAELNDTYGFDTLIVRNPTRDEIVATLKDYQSRFADGRLPQDGQLLVFFLGHGLREYGEGYFMPADVDPANLYGTALVYNYWRNFISSINCNHILVAVDACYSVTFDPNHSMQSGGHLERPGGELSSEDQLWGDYQRYRARLFFTSDSREDVTPGRSNFALQFLEGLRNRYDRATFTSAELFATYIEKARPIPRSGTFEKHEAGGRFLFSRIVSKNYDPQADIAAWEEAQAEGTALACAKYLRNFPNGSFVASAQRCVREKETQEQEWVAWQTACQQNTVKAYQIFIDAYPLSLYRQEAENRLNEFLSKPSGAMILVKGGVFEMGDVMNDKEQPRDEMVHSVAVSDFYLSPYELTFAEYDDFCNATGRKKTDDATWGRDNRPVINITWNDAIDYCNWRSLKEGFRAVYEVNHATQQIRVNWTANGYRLPTEAEWEYAARQGGQKVRFGNGQNTANPVAINFKATEGGAHYAFSGEDRQKTLPVGTLDAPNLLGLHDMSGNVWEWCWDWYGDYITLGTPNNPKGPASGVDRVIRGGAWSVFSARVRTAYRSGKGIGYRSNDLGFRLARSAQ